jgi:hypothetical protein
MREENAYDDLLSYYNNMYNNILSDSLLREINSFNGSSNPCSEIELPKEKKSEKPNFKQTKK